MSDIDMIHERGRGHEALLTALVADLRPIRPLGQPWARAALWLGAVAGLAIILACFADRAALAHRLMAVPDMWLAVLGSTLTGILASVAALQLALPDRSPAWGLLPIPALVLWVGASGLGCFRDWLIPGTTDATMREAGHCLTFIVGLSVPLSAAFFWLLRRGYSLHPSLMSLMAGLGVASVSATLLNFFHAYDATVTDLVVHAFAVGFVVAVTRLVAPRVLDVSEGPASPRRDAPP